MIGYETLGINYTTTIHFAISSSVLSDFNSYFSKLKLFKDLAAKSVMQGFINYRSNVYNHSIKPHFKMKLIFLNFHLFKKDLATDFSLIQY